MGGLKGRVSAFLSGGGRGSAALKTAVTAVLTRALSVVASLLTVPVVLGYLGKERYGLWTAAIALSTFFFLADGGINRGLLSQVSFAHGVGDRGRIRVLLASALAMTTAMVLVAIVVVVVAVGSIDWAWAFKLTSPELADEARLTVLTISLCYVLGCVPMVVRDARVGLLQGAVVNLWDAAGTAAAFFGVFLSAKMGFGLVAIAGAWAGAPVIVRAANALVFLRGEGRDLVPGWRYVDSATARSLMSAGGAFLLYTLTLVLTAQSDQVLIARFLGPEALASYAIPQRLFNQIQVVVMLGLMAQWPAYGEAFGSGDYAWIRLHFRHSLAAYTAVSAIVAAILAFFCDDILRIWVGSAIVAAPNLEIAFAIYSVVAAIANVFIFFYMALGMNKRLMLGQALVIAVTFPLYFILIPKLGGLGAVVSIGTGQLFMVVLPGIFSIRRMFSKLGARPRATEVVSPSILDRTENLPQAKGSIRRSGG